MVLSNLLSFLFFFLVMYIVGIPEKIHVASMFRLVFFLTVVIFCTQMLHHLNPLKQLLHNIFIHSVYFFISFGNKFCDT